MRADRQTWLTVMAGTLLALFAGEAVIRGLGTAIPPPVAWPTPETNLKSSQLATMEQEMSIVLLGSSITEAAVDPELLMDLSESGVVYNAALPFSTPLSDQVWLSEVILRHASPSMVIVGMPSWPPHTTVSDDQLRIGMELALADEATRAGSWSSALFENKGMLSDWDYRMLQRRAGSFGSWTPLGHQTGYYDEAGRTLRDLFPAYGEPAMSDDNRAALIETVLLLENRGIEVVLMIEPGRYPRQVSPSDVDAYLDSIGDLGAQLEVPLWNSHDRRWPDHLFADEAHFNRDGTVAFTTFVAAALERTVSGRSLNQAPGPADVP